MLTVKTTNSTTYPLEISEKGRFHKVNIHHFLLEDDDDWEDFINQLNFYRERYLDGSLEQLKKNIDKTPPVWYNIVKIKERGIKNVL